MRASSEAFSETWNQKPLVGLIHLSLRLTDTHHHDVQFTTRPFNHPPHQPTRTLLHPLVTLSLYDYLFSLLSASRLSPPCFHDRFLTLVCLLFSCLPLPTPGSGSHPLTVSTDLGRHHAPSIDFSSHPDRLIIPGIPKQHCMGRHIDILHHAHYLSISKPKHSVPHSPRVSSFCLYL